MITTKAIKTAEIVLTSDPYTVIANEVSIKNVCAYCFTFRGNDVEHDEHCDECEEAWYCNDECKKQHWESLHKVECPFMRKVREHELSSKFSKAKLRSLIRLLVKRDLERQAEAQSAVQGAGSASPDSPTDRASTPASPSPADGTPTGRTGPKFIDVESLIAHDEDSEDDDEEKEILAALKAVIEPRYIGDSTDEYLLKLMSRSECNQFGLWSPEDDLLGLSLHPSASFFNHSCIPNCYSEWSGINLVFKALYPIPAGAELTISYIDAHAPTRQRREELRNAYYFTCICPRCSKDFGKFPRDYYDNFYQRYLRCPKGPGLMRLDSYQGEEESQNASDDENSQDSKAKKDKKKKKKKRHNTYDGVELPKRIPFGYEVRSCMTCSTQRCSPCVPSVEEYLELYHIYEPVKYMQEPCD